jgi:signal transduction histidine kinase
LLEAYRAPLERLHGRLSDYWQKESARELPEVKPLRGEPGAVFAACVLKGYCDSLVLYDSAGNVRYPEWPVSVPEETEAADSKWETAQHREFYDNDPGRAAKLYLEAVHAATQPAQMTRGLVAAARCLARDGRKPQAIDLLTQVLDDPVQWALRDAGGRRPAVDAGLLLLGLLDPAGDGYPRLATRLAGLANDYNSHQMPAAQRRALMAALTPLLGPDTFLTLPAERLAAEYVEAQGLPPDRGRLIRAPIPGVWQLALKDGTGVALYREARLEAQMAIILTSEPVSGATIRLLRPDQSGAEPFLTLPAAEAMPSWRLALNLAGTGPFADAAERRTSVYLWIGLAVALLTAMMTLLVGRHVGRQVRLTRLKNDLIATVSHELKTPLAGIRALVETLLDKDLADRAQAREYLELIARENLRLSRLIDNFLAFSRMERNKHAFEFAEVSPGEIVATAVEAAGERFAAPGCRLETEIAPNLPPVVADRDALLTVLLNLLDNAYKYTGENKRIHLRAYAADGRVCFEVRDNGIGLSRRAARRVFDRFYQADRKLSRKAGGCGLGLSIVKFITEAHGGSVEVESQPGSGSVFRVSLPAEARGEK